jgi:hypothetical protein
MRTMPKISSVAALALGALLPIAAQNPGPASHQPPDAAGEVRSSQMQGRTIVVGTISSVGVDRFEVKKQDGSTQTVLVNEQTRYYEGGRRGPRAWRRGAGQAPGAEASAPNTQMQLEDLKPGDHVFVVVQNSAGGGESTATVVRRLSEQQWMMMAGSRVFGQITGIQGNMIKIQNRMQGEREIWLTDQTQFVKNGQPVTLQDLKVGDRIFAVGQEKDGKFTAHRVMTGMPRGGMRRGMPPQPEPQP